MTRVGRWLAAQTLRDKLLVYLIGLVLLSIVVSSLVAIDKIPWWLKAIFVATAALQGMAVGKTVAWFHDTIRREAAREILAGVMGVVRSKDDHAKYSFEVRPGEVFVYEKSLVPPPARALEPSLDLPDLAAPKKPPSAPN